MTIQDNSEPVFPHEFKYGDGRAQRCVGMTLRDYFAAKAMQGLLSDPNIKASANEFAAQAYTLADAMLKARSAE